MTQVTTASIAYTATQVFFYFFGTLPSPLTLRHPKPSATPNKLRFALSSSAVFCRSDTSTDSERFYESVLHFLDDPEEKEEVDGLLNWWNW